ncbi:hypothetical protein CHS0354_018608 [Potamilus streckersoni]|uniref:Uncharacterized protein n=1 Tax=Potamilus streckersoni TaxID=2493646 RepID=A0AAE0TFM2_9BIVA|nr:hypothetical protein CHS0354_018608 [Potamilus streckersoni]
MIFRNLSQSRKTDSKSRTRMVSKVNEDYTYSSPVAEANDTDLSGSQNVHHYEMLQESRHDLDQNKHYDKIQINVTTVSTDASTTETGNI